MVMLMDNITYKTLPTVSTSTLSAVIWYKPIWFGDLYMDVPDGVFRTEISGR